MKAFIVLLQIKGPELLYSLILVSCHVNSFHMSHVYANAKFNGRLFI